MNRAEITEIREEFPFLDEKKTGKKIIYLDNAATTQKPRCVTERLCHYYSHENANPHRGAHYLGIRATELYEEARKNVSEFIDAASPDEVVFVRNATEGLNLVAHSYATNHLRPGDEILITVMEHHSNLVPWQEAARRTGATLRFVYLTEDLNVDMEDFRSKLNLNTKLFAVTGASNTIAAMPDIRTMIREAKSFGAVTVVDGAQLIPHKLVDVKETDCDFLVFSGHKMYAPMGIGALYGKRSLLEEMSPYQYGGDMIEYVYEQESTFAPVPSKFEAGTQNVGGAVALSRAVDFLRNLGMEKIDQHEQELTKYTLERMKQMNFVHIYRSSGSDGASLIAFNVEGVHSHDVSSILDSFGIAIRSGHHCTMPLHKYLQLNSTCRISFAVYNTMEEADYFLEKLQEVRKVMGLGT